MLPLVRVLFLTATVRQLVHQQKRGHPEEANVTRVGAASYLFPKIQKAATTYCPLLAMPSAFEHMATYVGRLH